MFQQQTEIHKIIIRNKAFTISVWVLSFARLGEAIRTALAYENYLANAKVCKCNSGEYFK